MQRVRVGVKGILGQATVTGMPVARMDRMAGEKMPSPEPSTTLAKRRETSPMRSIESSRARSAPSGPDRHSSWAPSHSSPTDTPALWLQAMIVWSSGPGATAVR